MFSSYTKWETSSHKDKLLLVNKNEQIAFAWSVLISGTEPKMTRLKSIQKYLLKNSKLLFCVGLRMTQIGDHTHADRVKFVNKSWLKWFFPQTTRNGLIKQRHSLYTWTCCATENAMEGATRLDRKTRNPAFELFAGNADISRFLISPSICQWVLASCVHWLMAAKSHERGCLQWSN